MLSAPSGQKKKWSLTADVVTLTRIMSNFNADSMPVSLKEEKVSWVKTQLIKSNCTLRNSL